MADLEHIHMPEQAAFEEQCLDGSLRVAREQGTEAAALQQDHHRCVVDIAIRKRREGVGVIREDHAQATVASERNDLAGPSQAEFNARLRAGERHEAGIGWVLVGTAGLDHQVHVEALQGRHQAGHVILVWVSQHHHVQPSLPERQPLAEPA